MLCLHLSLIKFFLKKFEKEHIIVLDENIIKNDGGI